MGRFKAQSLNLSLKKIDLSYLAIVQTILDSAPSFHLLVEGVTQAGPANSVFEELPPGRTIADKHVLLIEESGLPVGVIDLIIGYPKDGIAFIGLLVLDEKHQGRGIGRASYQLLEDYFLPFNIASIELGVNDTNLPGMAFWHKLGFQKNGRTRVHEGKKLTSTVIVLEKRL